MSARLALLIALCASAHPAQAQDAGVPPGPAELPAQELRAGFAGSAPFVTEGPTPDGLSVAVFRAAADAAGLHYRFVQQPGVAEALQAVKRGELDVAVGPISITAERAREVEFTQPYFESRIGIVSAESGSLWRRVVPFLTRVFAAASLALAVSLLIIGALIWLLERRHNPEQFPPDPIRGIANGVWFALVTMTTVGYGDRAPITPAGRVLSSVWMLVALVTTSSFTAGIASAFTVLQLDSAAIRDARDLAGRKVAAIRGTTGAAFATDHGARLVPTDDLQHAIDAVHEGRAIAVVHDRPILKHYLKDDPVGGLQLAAAAYDPQGYGFALARGHPAFRSLNVSLLAAKEEGTVSRIVRTWLGAGD